MESKNHGLRQEKWRNAKGSNDSPKKEKIMATGIRDIICTGTGWICRERKKSACKKDCKSWFALDSEKPIMKGCKNACKTNYDTLTKDDYLCGGSVSQQEFFRIYGYDPCTGDTQNIPCELDAVCSEKRRQAKEDEMRGAEAEQQEFFRKVAVMALLVVAAIIALKFIK